MCEKQWFIPGGGPLSVCKTVVYTQEGASPPCVKQWFIPRKRSLGVRVNVSNVLGWVGEREEGYPALPLPWYWQPYYPAIAWDGPRSRVHPGHSITAGQRCSAAQSGVHAHQAQFGRNPWVGGPLPPSRCYSC